MKFIYRFGEGGDRRDVFVIFVILFVRIVLRAEYMDFEVEYLIEMFL